MSDAISSYTKEFHVRWADCDFNGHMRHSAFNDYGAHIRVSMFSEFGLPIEKLMHERMGPVLFREETRFYKELRLNEKFTVDCEIISMRRNGKIWSMHHHFYNVNNDLAAEITVEGAWMDLDKRKVVTPPADYMEFINKFPRGKEFVWLDNSQDNRES
ncbi:MAG: thioesterase family protein [Gammaproteobacteria bacterium]|nr:thioesterase family protein [Gammaproteobacteria bacterium]